LILVRNKRWLACHKVSSFWIGTCKLRIVNTSISAKSHDVRIHWSGTHYLTFSHSCTCVMRQGCRYCFNAFSRSKIATVSSAHVHRITCTHICTHLGTPPHDHACISKRKLIISQLNCRCSTLPMPALVTLSSHQKQTQKLGLLCLFQSRTPSGQ